MIIDLKKLRTSGKQESDFYFEYSPEENLSEIPETKIVAPIKITGTVTLTDVHSAYIEGEIVYTLKGECTRCLSVTEREYLVEFGEQVGDGEDYPVVNDKVDLAKIVFDRVITSLPMNFLCKDDCKGICPKCGVNLNQEECKCKK